MPVQETARMALVELPHVSSNTLLIGSLGVAFLAIVVAFFLLRSRSSTRGNSILLVGSSDSGKTAILSTLCLGQTLPSQTSVQVNSSTFLESPNSKKSLTVIDIPGHPRLRGLFKDHLSDAKAVLFVVDTSTVTRNGKDVAEHLHHILHELTSLPPSQKLPPLLVLAHKADLISAGSNTSQDRCALSVSRVRTVLERELEKRRVASATGVGVEKLGAEDESVEMGGLECSNGGSFRFVDWEGGEVSFVGTWVKAGRPSDEKVGEDGLQPLRDWVWELA